MKQQNVPVTVGLRVRNLGNGQTGTVVACRGRTQGTFRVSFDNGQEWEWEIKRFESEDGWPLQDVEAVPASINLRIRCWMDGRCGRIAYIHNDFPQRIWVQFDDGDAGEKDATWFVTESGDVPVGPGHKGQEEWAYNSGKGGKGDVYQSQEWEKPGKGGKSHYPQGRSESWKDNSYDSYDPNWWESEGAYSTGRQSAKGNKGKDTETKSKGKGKDSGKASGKDSGKASGKDSGKASGKDSGKASGKDSGKDSGKSSGKGKGKGKGESELGEVALREVIDQLLDESNEGRVWITNWPGRFQSTFGQLRDFLLLHPDKFTIIPESGRRFTVAFAGGAPPASAKTEKKKKGKKLKWMKTNKTAAGEEAEEEASEEKEQKEEQNPSSRRRGDDEDDKTAFDEDNEDSDDPVEDAMKSRENDAAKDKQEESAEA